MSKDAPRIKVSPMLNVEWRTECEISREKAIGMFGPYMRHYVYLEKAADSISDLDKSRRLQIDERVI